ncbi:MAG: TraB/GumN family protein [Deltaproteobacteria bacterium]
MIWQVQKNGRTSHLIGTAHFFPYSFRDSLQRYLGNGRLVMFEGPLDEDNMDRVRQAGIVSENSYHIFNELDNKTIAGLTEALVPVCRARHSSYLLTFCKFDVKDIVYEMVKDMQPWLAFFTLWSEYLRRIGWKYSVDLEGYQIAGQLGKKIVFLETIEEQIKVLQNISHDNILFFLSQVARWKNFAREYVECYLDGDLEKLKFTRVRFPSRHYSVINERDKIFFERMSAELEKGQVVAFVGAPHLKGLSRLLIEDGYRVKGPWLPQS